MRITTAEYTDVSALMTALGGAHVVILTVTVVAIDAQVHIALAAKATGVQAFIPSVFGGSMEHVMTSSSASRVRCAPSCARWVPYCC